MPPEAVPPTSELESRLELAGTRARRSRGAGGALSARAAHDLRDGLLAAAVVPLDAPAASEDETPLRVERRRWTRATTPKHALTRTDLPAAPAGVLLPSVIAAPIATPQIRRTRWSGGRLHPLRLVAAVVILALLVGTVAYGANLLHGQAALTASVIEASGASATRVGVVIPLTAGTALQVGDTVTVASQGQAILALGTSQERLDSGAAIHLDRLDDAGVGVSQLTGRAYTRVGVGEHRTFQVVTGPVTWTATGTAFDIDRELVASGPEAGQEQVTLLAIQDGVTATGPGFDTLVPQGDRATILIGAASPIAAPTLDRIPASLLLDPWLQANGALDQQAGLPLGVLAGHLQTPQASGNLSQSPFVTPSPGSTDTAVPSGLETPTPPPIATPSPVGKPVRTPTPTPTPSPSPTPAPTIGSLSLTATTCPGGVVLDWSRFGSGGGFRRYVTLRAPAPRPGVNYPIPLVYPPKLSYITVVANTTSPNALSAADTAGQETLYTYRTLVLGINNQVLATSGTPTAGGAGQPEPLVLDAPTYSSSNTSFTWTPFTGSAACFSEYEVFDISTHKIFGTLVGPQAWTGFTVDNKSCTGDMVELLVFRNLWLGSPILTGQSAPITC